MSVENAFYIGLGLFMGTLVVLEIYFAVRIRKNKREAKAVESHMSPRATFRYSLFLIAFYVYLVVWASYSIWAKNIPALLGIAFIIGSLILMQKPLAWVRSSRPISADFSIAVPLQADPGKAITPDFILEVLGQESVISAIKDDLKKTRLIGRKEQWRLGLLSPEMDTYDLSYNQLSRQERLRKGFDPATMINMANQIPIKRAAIIHATSYFNAQFNNLLILHGTREPMIRSYPGWSYHLKSRRSDNDYEIIRNLEIDTDSPSARGRNPVLTKFLQEDGFPLRNSYLDGDPLTTERGGTIVSDKGKVKIIYSDYFVQSRLIDDEGNLVYMGLDENFQPSSTWRGISVIPSVSKKLYKCVETNEYIPIVRYRSFP